MEENQDFNLEKFIMNLDKTKEFYELEEFEQMIKYDKLKMSYIISNEYDYLRYSPTCLSHLSIFDIINRDKNEGDTKERSTLKQDKEKTDVILGILKDKNLNEKLKREELEKLGCEKELKGIGSMLGMAIGDAMGARLEFQDVRYEYEPDEELKDMGTGKGGNFDLEPGQWTDDTSMGLCLADSLIVNNGKFDPFDLMNRFIAWWRGGYNNAFRYDKHSRHSVGLGGNISMALYRYLLKPEAETKAGNIYTSGNGSIMRNAAIPICFHNNIKLAYENAEKQSLTTHQGIEAKECCSLLTHIIVKIFEGNKLKEILDTLGETFKTSEKSIEYLAKSIKEEENRDWDWKKEKYIYSPQRTEQNMGYIGSYAMDNMAMSLHIVYHTNSFKEAIIKAVNLRGDSDSVASVVGQIAGAYYPIEEIPSDWIETVNKWDNGEIALRGYILARIPYKKSYYKEEQNQ